MNYSSCCTSSGPPSFTVAIGLDGAMAARKSAAANGMCRCELEPARDPHHRAAGILSGADLVEHTDHVLDVDVV